MNRLEKKSVKTTYVVVTVAVLLVASVLMFTPAGQSFVQGFKDGYNDATKHFSK